MEEQQRKNIIRVLTEALDALKKGNINQLKDLSNQTLHDASIIQDQYSISIAVLVYSLSKIYEREYHYSKFKGFEAFCFDCTRGLEVLKEKLERNDIESFNNTISKYLKTLNKVHKRLKNYIEDVFSQAKITKASRIHEHGISLGRTAELLGISKFELMDYVGRTYIADAKEAFTIDPEKRLKFARSLFKWKQ